MRPGQRVGKYVLGERIARGGMAEVWAARVEGPQGFVKSVALKFVVDSGDPELERLFVNEARLAAGLQHPNLVTVFDFDRVPDGALEPEDGSGRVGRSYIAMERIEGHDLRRVLRVCRERGLRFPVGLSLYVAGEVLQGLRYVHERPIGEAGAGAGVGTDRGGVEGATLVHRDVSPHNILVAYSGDVKLSDFGIAKVVTRVPGVQSGLVRGKVAYASPEQILGQSVDHRSDQFSLGVTLWELLAGHRLFGGTTDVETMNRVLAGDVPPLPSERRVPSAIEAVVRRMLAARPEQRFRSTAGALSAVMALPDYSGDGTALGAWMREQFAGSNLVLPTTQLLDLSGAELGHGPDGQHGQHGQHGHDGQGAFAAGDPVLPALGLKVEAGSTQRMHDGRSRSPTGRRPDAGAEPREARPGHRRGGARTDPSPAVHPPIGQLPDEARPEAELPPAELPVVRAPSGTTGRRRRPAPHSVPVVIDFATRAPLRSGRPAWSRWGMVAALVALATWGAALGIRHSVRLALEPARPLRPISSRRHPAPDPDTHSPDPTPPTELASTTPTSSPAADPPPADQPPSGPAPDEPPSAGSPSPGDEALPSDTTGSSASVRHRPLRSNGLSPNGAPIIE